MSVGQAAGKAGSDTSVSGFELTLSQGGIFVWSEVITTQTPNYADISTTQTPDWSEIAA